MSLLNKLVFLLLLVSFYAPSYAAVDGFDLDACSVFSDAKDGAKKGEGKDGKKGEEEPDCE